MHVPCSCSPHLPLSPVYVCTVAACQLQSHSALFMKCTIFLSDLNVIFSVTLYIVCACMAACVCVYCMFFIHMHFLWKHHWALFPHISRFILATFFLSVAFARGEVGLTSFTLTDSLHFLIFVSNFCFYIILFNSGVLSFNFHKLNLCLLVFLLSSNHDRNVMFWFIFIMLSALLRTTAYVAL